MRYNSLELERWNMKIDRLKKYAEKLVARGYADRICLMTERNTGLIVEVGVVLDVPKRGEIYIEVDPFGDSIESNRQWKTLYNSITDELDEG